jgi:hypothetical protein
MTYRLCLVALIVLQVWLHQTLFVFREVRPAPGHEDFGSKDWKYDRPE